MHLCYDIWFHNPSLAMVLNDTLGIRDFVFSMHSENEEGGPIGMGSMMMEGWSRGAGANLVGANAGMGLMHTGSAIVTQGKSLVHTWQPDNAHDEALLIATVPRLTKTTPNLVDGAATSRWGNSSTKEILQPPVWEVLSIAPGSKGTHTVTASGDFRCHFEWEAAAQAEGPELHLVVAANGSWFGGGLPCRACEMFRLPRSIGGYNGSMPLSEWRPWWETAIPLYRGDAAFALEDLGGNITFKELSIRGDFRPGDLILPIFAAKDGVPGGSSLEVVEAGRGVKLIKPEPVTQLQLLVNTANSYQIFSDLNEWPAR